MAKKSFVQGNPALQFISKPEETKEEPKKESKPVEPVKEKTEPAAVIQTDAPEGYKVNPYYIEKKTRRLQLLMQPSLHAKVKEAADADGVSVNDFIHKVLENYLKGE